MTNTPFRISPDERIAGIEHSLHCFRFAFAGALATALAPIAALLVVNAEPSNRLVTVACVGWIPEVILIFSILARFQNQKALRSLQKEWNPARAYVVWGRVLSGLGIFVSSLLLMLFAICLFLKDVFF